MRFYLEKLAENRPSLTIARGKSQRNVTYSFVSLVFPVQKFGDAFVNGQFRSQVAGFEAGADDYIAKPIKPKLLVSKVKALLRRLKNEVSSTENLTVGNIVINREEYKIIQAEKEIVLPRKEFELFYLLASKPGKVFKREEILDKVWGNEVIVGGRTIDVHIRKLREKIGEELFKTIKGVGYKFEI